MASPKRDVLLGSSDGMSFHLMEYAGTPRFTVLFPSCFADIMFFYKLKVGGSPPLSQSISTLFPTSAHFVPLSHFDKSHTISTFSMIIFVTVICGP